MDYKSPLHRMAMTSPTEFRNDSCAVCDLEPAIANGAVGATRRTLNQFLGGYADLLATVPKYMVPSYP